MKAQTLFNKTYGKPKDKWDGTAKRFDMWDMLNFAEEYAQHSAQVRYEKAMEELSCLDSAMLPEFRKEVEPLIKIASGLKD